MTNWLLNPGNATNVAAISFIVGGVGTLLTLIGLFFTFIQARRAASAASLVRTAVNDFRFRLSHHDAARDASEALYALDVTRRHLNNDAWRDAVDSYEDARRAILRIIMSLPTLDANIILDLHRTASQMRLFCNKVDAALGQKSEYPDVAKSKAVIRKNYDSVAAVQRLINEDLT